MKSVSSRFSSLGLKEQSSFDADCNFKTDIGARLFDAFVWRKCIINSNLTSSKCNNGGLEFIRDSRFSGIIVVVLWYDRCCYKYFVTNPWKILCWMVPTMSTNNYMHQIFEIVWSKNYKLPKWVKEKMLSRLVFGRKVNILLQRTADYLLECLFSVSLLQLGFTLHFEVSGRKMYSLTWFSRKVLPFYWQVRHLSPPLWMCLYWKLLEHNFYSLFLALVFFEYHQVQCFYNVYIYIVYCL